MPTWRHECLLGEVVGVTRRAEIVLGAGVRRLRTEHTTGWAVQFSGTVGLRKPAALVHHPERPVGRGLEPERMTREAFVEVGDKVIRGVAYAIVHGEVELPQVFDRRLRAKGTERIGVAPSKDAVV